MMVIVWAALGLLIYGALLRSAGLPPRWWRE